ncbi:PhzF family phenazine biosynthesis protein [Marinobacterium rhizophilum]|uniref:PhzF family phenazine biosynthesis protein n=1 Tax=Marinobacterium rhizophilum TaxID=420402 RepID=UPI0003758FEB|nr:PhzF family phenazine biosynthesis protein [Marinobacterium rhizophilum]
MSALAYYTLDVFTDRPFAGNPLAVFPDAGELPLAQMQQLASELNLSETVFVTSAGSDNRFDVRIFTPGGEIPFAGHPTVGTALLLARLGRLAPEQGTALTLVQRVGDVPVQIRGQGDAAIARFRTVRVPELTASPLSREEAAALVGLEPSQLLAAPVVASCGTPFQMLQVTDVESLGRAALDLALWRRLLSGHSAPDLYLYSLAADRRSARTRMFGPGFNIAEDPATGAAASALAGMLAGAVPGCYRLRIEQGVEMGRPSLIETEVRVTAEGAEAVFVEGQARFVSEGHFYLS